MLGELLPFWARTLPSQLHGMAQPIASTARREQGACPAGLVPGPSAVVGGKGVLFLPRLI